MISNTELQSRTIALLRFPLIVGVVLIHSYTKEIPLGGETLQVAGNPDFPLFSTFAFYISQVISRLAVPMFFFFSGYLFFCKLPSAGFTFDTYKQKLKKRARTLLVPYILWNALVLLFTFSGQVAKWLMGEGGESKRVWDYSLSDFFYVFWDRRMIAGQEALDVDRFPLDYPLWFIRDLMVVMLFSPLIYFLIRKLRHYVILIPAALWFFKCWPEVPGFSAASWFFFSAGAYFSIWGRNFVSDFRRLFPASIVLYLFVSVADLYFQSETWHTYIHQTGILIGIPAAISLTAWFIQRGTWRETPFLAASSFFVYAYHAYPLSTLSFVLYRILRPASDAMFLFLYILRPLLIILIGLGIYYMMKKWMPKVAGVLTGGR